MSYKHILIFILFFTTLGSFAQDIIIQNNGDRIYCRILREDSANIYYSVANRKTEFKISRINVYKYDIFAAKKKKVDSLSSKEYSEILLINLSAGSAEPLGDFASKDATSEKSGLAKTGFVFHPYVILKFSTFIGFSFGYRYQTHKFADDLVLAQLQVANPGFRFSVSSTNWIIRGFFGGLHITAPIKNIPHLSFDADLSFGFPKFFLPGLIVYGSNGLQGGVITQEPSNTTAPAVLGGIGLKYRVHKNIALSINATYLQAKANFTGIYTHSTNGNFSYDNYSQKITTFNVQFGLCFLIFDKIKSTRGR